MCIIREKELLYDIKIIIFGLWRLKINKIRKKNYTTLRWKVRDNKQ
jgi:hypothetical protein